MTGIRRCGKTTLFELFRKQIVESGLAADRIIAINFEDPDCASFAGWREAWEFIKPNIKPDGRTYVFLDEVQNVPEFEKLVDGLYSRKNLDVYITGSNAKFLSGELATFLTGRYVAIRLQPLHFTEYITLFPDRDAHSIFNDFLRFGGFPFAAQLANGSHTQLDYLSGILDTVLYKDVMARNGYRDEATLSRELAPLRAIRDNRPKFLLTLDNDPPLDHDGIKRMNVVEFLLDPKSLKTL